MLRNFSLPLTQHKERSKKHVEKGSEFLNSVKSFDFEQFSNLTTHTEAPEILIAGEDPREKETSFGPSGSIVDGACIVYATRYVMLKYGLKRDILDLAKEAVEKGYRSWRFANYAKPIFYTEKVEIDEVKKAFADIAEVKDCQTVEELTQILGEVLPIGGSAFFMDNVICDYLAKTQITPVEDTRITTVEKLIENLKNGIMVPMRVNNSIYHNDPNRKGGHNIVLLEVNCGEAIVADSSMGINKLPIERLLAAAVENPNLIAVWDLSKI